MMIDNHDRFEKDESFTAKQETPLNGLDVDQLSFNPNH